MTVINWALPQKSLKHGYAAWCEDVALPFRRTRPFLSGLALRILMCFRGVRHSRHEKDNR
jgi:hypothetical protein